MRLISNPAIHPFRLEPLTHLNRYRLLANHFRRKLPLFLLVVGLVAVAACPPLAVAEESAREYLQTEVGTLEPKIPVERELAGGQTHSYRLTLQAGQYLYVVVEQKGIDVAMALFAPDGAKVTESILPDILQGRKTIRTITEQGGNYRLEIRSKNKAAIAGRYEVQIYTLREATQQDRTRLTVRKIVEEANHLQEQGTAESLKSAIEKIEEALPLMRSIEDRAGEAEALGNQARAHFLLADYQKTVDITTRALAIWKETDERRGQAVAYSFLYSARYALGDWEGALEALKRGLPITQALGDRNGEASMLGNLGVYYAGVGDSEKALEYFQLSLPIRREVGDRRGEAVTLGNIGTRHQLAGDLQKAIEYYNQAVALCRAIGERRSLVSQLIYLALANSAMGDKQAALNHLKEALPLSRAVGDRHGESVALRAFGDQYLSLGEPQKALEPYNDSLVITRAIGNRDGEARSLHNIARAHRDLNQLNQAREPIEAAIKIIESFRSRLQEQQSRSSYFAKVNDYYDLYIDILMQQGKEQPSENLNAVAIEASERARARSLLELLTEARIEIRQGVDAEMLRRERTLQQSLNTKAQLQTRLLSGKHTPEQAEAMASQIAALTTELRDVRAQIRSANPRYAALTQPGPLTLKEIQQQLLDTDTLLLEYALGDRRSYLWAVTQTSITAYELPARTEIEAAARRFYDLIKDPTKTVELTEAAIRLSQMVLAPAAEQFSKKRLAVVADGALLYVPFAALPIPETGSRKPVTGGAGSRSPESGVRRPTSEASKEVSQGIPKDQPPATDYRPQTTGYRPLIVEHEIVSLPSASSLALVRHDLKGRTRAPKEVAVLADPVFDINDVRLRRSATLTTRNQKSSDGEAVTNLVRSVKETGLANGEWPLPRLLGTRREATAILNLAPETKRRRALDFEANREVVTGGELSQYKILHFATHGILNNQHPELSGIVLSLVDGQGRAQDGFLRLHEIYNLRLPVELVVLSACQTGLGKEIRGEGLVGLTRGFMYAGAPRLVTSLWQVDDKASSELMKRFYQEILEQKLSAAAALRVAQIQMWQQKDWRSPYYWAAFTLHGEWQ
jgi:CHAT domain-containing protein/tetratricopeptide (TPR) repeat protein